MDRKIAIIPTYNEKENIEKIIRAVFGLEGEYHILVIEDGSPDGTAAIVKKLQDEFPERLYMIERKGKLSSFGLLTTLYAGALIVFLLSQILLDASLSAVTLKSLKSVIQRFILSNDNFGHLFPSLQNHFTVFQGP